jgi:hypothetical protein
MISTQSRPRGDAPSEEEDMNATTAQAEDQAQSLVRYFRLSRESCADLIKTWMIQRLLGYHKLVQDIKNLDMRELFVENSKLLGRDFIDFWFRALVLSNRNLLILQRDLGKQAHSIRETTGFQPVKESVYEGVRDAMTPSSLVKYMGIADVWVAHSDGGSIKAADSVGEVKLQRGELYLLVVEFSSSGPKEARGITGAVEAPDGEDRDEVPFDLYPDSTDIRFVPHSASVMVPSSGTSDRCKFEFASPPNAGTHEIWLEIGQARRAIQVISITINVTDT